MISEDGYEAFIHEIGCPRNAGSTYATLIPIKQELVRRAVECVPQCLPQDSNVYVKEIKYFDYFRHTRDQAFTQMVHRKINEIECHVAHKEDIMRDIIALFGLGDYYKTYGQHLEDIRHYGNFFNEIRDFL